MKFEQNRELLPYAVEMCKSMTREERRLWYEFLRDCPVKFRRQQIIGNYIVDFYCHSKKLVVELDGSQHYGPDGAEYDRRRDGFLRDRGLTVLRYSNSDVDRRFRSVCEDILKHLDLL